MIVLQEYFVYDGDDRLVELGYAAVSLDYLLLDHLAVRFFCELAAIETVRAEKPLHHVDSLCIHIFFGDVGCMYV